MKKLMFILAFLSISVNSIYAMKIQFDQWKYDLLFDSPVIQLKFDTKTIEEAMGKNKNNWVAIYKKGASNDWKNVIQWSWVKDLPRMLFYEGTEVYRYFKYNLPNGEYECRFFLNNTYETFASFAFTADKAIDYPKLSIAKQTEDQIIFNSTYEKKTWIGIYPAGISKNDWKYVKAWTWVKSQSPSIDLQDLPWGDYVARLFYNNSYKAEKEITFSHNGIN